MADLKIWTDSTDYVIAESAEAARLAIVHGSGISDEEVGPLKDWSAYADDDPFPWQDEEGGPTRKIPAAEAVRKLTEGGVAMNPMGCKADGCSCARTYFFASTEW